MANSKAKIEEKILKIPTLNLGKRPSMFSGGRGFQIKMPGARFVPPVVRVTQSKGAGGK
ncbi:MAG: hypothetical protein UU16_C0003G0026 [Candidatus Woesebacteria bacterium GW2011_GWA2_40_7]|uniref:Uncharacterized protein n=3 Tax=Candidatus Woeseibacteriota TaxID=1752722 RepID=A0A0G0X7L7_9BACT|nr:MAG: hypothetical protein UT17_C0002G0009 [Candidatus Woesebacteria bacterium GW2011_GWB1_39_10]KKR74265.1 MAG: hypothetical protein UU16_C0003G0026 [Candidatus Woesebacteria bacterium GW2011_GWA2_40_7]KKR92640.1 MAG: hypothetical protein UU42_C0001G0244 [Candidatus Woesebacteria bacterium GW2011_GWA1_41_13b]